MRLKKFEKKEMSGSAALHPAPLASSQHRSCPGPLVGRRWGHLQH